VKICVVGVGAIGGFLGTRLALDPNNTVTALARRATLVALRDHGWRLHQDGELLHAPAAAPADDARELGPQDLVIVAVKSQALPALAPALTPLLSPDTIVLPAMNGVPWWFSVGVAPLEAGPLESVDPGGHIAAAIPVGHVVGCVVHAAASVSEPGVTTHRMGRGLIIGEPQGSGSARVKRLGETLVRAGFEVTCSPRIRYDVWYKLWGNMTMNPVSALTGATTDRLLDDDLVRTFCAGAMREAAAVGARIGCDVRESPDDRQAVTRRLGVFKTSMLQDVEASRTLELDALVGAVREIGARVGIATPMTDALFGLTRLFGQVHGLYPQHRAD
jgi:2-dehydropantoate 2-reductase